MKAMIECEKPDFEKTIKELERKGFMRDESYDPVPIPREPGGTLILRGEFPDHLLDEINEMEGVFQVWPDPPVQAF
jgi:hypothetical protein